MTLKLSDDWRIIHEPRQWVLQHRQGAQWHARSFCCSKAALLRCIREYCGNVDLRGVLTFPCWHPDRAMRATKGSPATETPSGGSSPLLPVSEGDGGAE